MTINLGPGSRPNWIAIRGDPVDMTSLGVRSVTRPLLGAALLVVLASCYADLDWREVRDRDGSFRVLLPARANEQSGPLSGVAGSPVMHLWSARASNTLFGAGYLDVRPGDRVALTDLRDALVLNIGGRIVSDRSVRSSSLQGVEFIAEGSMGNGMAILHARLLVSDNRIYQLAVLGPQGAVTTTDKETFFESLWPHAVRPFSS